MTAFADVGRSRSREADLPPGPPEPRVFQLAYWLARPVEFLERARSRYGDIFMMHLPGLDPWVCYTDPEAIKTIFTGPSDQLYAGQANLVLEPLLGFHSVLMLDGNKHMSQRRLLLPPFHGQRMRAYGEAMRDITLRSMEDWPRGQAFPMHGFAQGITLDVILRTVFGMTERGAKRSGATSGEPEGAAMTELREALRRMLELTSNPVLLFPWAQADLGPLSPGGKMRRVMEEVDRLIYAEIRKRRAEGREGREDVLSMLIEARHEDGSPMSEAELRDELLTLLVAGHETTATSLAFTLQRLMESPDALERAVAEVDQAFGVKGTIDPDGVRELAWIDAVIKETLRLNPVIPLVGRRLQSPMHIGGWDLPAHVIAVPAIYLAHRNPRVWPDPDRFDPARFVGAKPNPYAFFPFGGGVRRCIGMAFALYEMQVVLATLLSRLRVTPAPGYRARLVRRAITFAPSEGMPIVVRDR